jgi:Tfp pilus assembly protein FimT
MFTDNAKQADAINELVASMHQARNTAILKKSRVRMCSSSDGAICNGANWNEQMDMFPRFE